MIKITIFFGTLLFILCILLGFARKTIKRKNQIIKELRDKIDFLKEINSRFEKIEYETKQDKRKISSGSVTDNVNASADVLRDIKKRRRTSNN